ncbi:flavodoxin [Chelonobacter oris]|uniref:Flavodoxin n=1 Tax=Chelonobacter oris TaxID=505317 RepID=A0A0A3AP41_9PAST|nr:flavodoxin [Chelonobacter oris]KGQ71116.1 flavodoxin [Chelonobacter oris]
MKTLTFTSFLRNLILPLALTITTHSALADLQRSGSNPQRILISYFSHMENVDLNGADAASGASVLLKNGERVGSTEYMAQVIQKTSSGDLFRIETAQPYPKEHDPLLDQARDELRRNFRPQLQPKLPDLSNYDVVFIGYPIWWYDFPVALYSFLEQNDFSGKTVIPFSTHGGSRFLNTIRDMGRLQPNAKLNTQGLTISRERIGNAESDIVEWVKQLGYAQ